MTPARYRLTLGQLLVLIAGSAVVLAILRSPFWPFLPATAPIMPGFAIDRSRGGPGIVGAMLSGAIGFVAIGGGPFLYDLVRHGTISCDVPTMSLILMAFALVGLAVGWVVGAAAFGIMLLLGRPVPPGPGPQAEPVGPIGWRGFADRGLADPRTGGSQP